MWQSNAPVPSVLRGVEVLAGRGTCERMEATTGAPKVMLGTKWPSIMSTWSQSADWPIVVEQAVPRLEKSAERMDGAIMAGGDIVGGDGGSGSEGRRVTMIMNFERAVNDVSRLLST
jgi:hypothetical protein